ncbi:hypothetical protein G3A39_42270 [Paraburkholderia aspalathi]|nr:hypothetical protein [Paraburkholderia aspalathi]
MIVDQSHAESEESPNGFTARQQSDNGEIVTYLRSSVMYGGDIHHNLSINGAKDTRILSDEVFCCGTFWPKLSADFAIGPATE